MEKKERDIFQFNPNQSKLEPPGLFRFFRSERHVVMAVLFIFGAFGLIAGIVQIRKHVNAPLALPEFRENKDENFNPEKELAQLQQKDTDQDTISDFDELYAHNSSPYLKDSDSDGLDDPAEVKAGSDPNCPLGRVCGSFESQNEPETQESEIGFENTLSPSAFETLLNEGKVGPDQMRELLKNAGAPQNIVDDLSDEAVNTLLKSSSAGEEPDLQALRNLTASDIRVLLKGTGGDAKAIDAMDDQTIVKIFQQGIDQQYPFPESP